MTYRVLLVDDDVQLAELVVDYLSPHGFAIETVTNGDLAVNKILVENPDAVLLDVNLPGTDGFSICREVREQFHGPIILLTARDTETDEVLGLEFGADDFLAKPVSPRVLLARLRMHLRRIPTEETTIEENVLELGALKIDRGRRSVKFAGNLIPLSTAEFDLLWLLAQNAGSVVSRAMLFESLHGFKFDGFDRSIDLRVSRLRKKLGDDPQQPTLILSIRGIGYQLSIESS
ncbi:MAG: response regulator transcription factor [Planctomycetaceae bacterium]|nr:response regulator transcription factor [Planctomycetaceae bacterium]